MTEDTLRKRLEWKLDVDLDDVKKDLVVLGSDLKRAGSAVNDMAKDFSKAVDAMGSEVQTLNRDLKAGLSAGFSAVTRAITELKTSLAPVAREVNAFGKQTGDAFKSLKTQVESVDKALRQSDMSKWQKVADNYSASIAKANAQLNEMRKKLDDTTLSEKKRAAIQKEVEEGEKRIAALTLQAQQHVQKLKQAEQEKADAARKAHADRLAAAAQVSAEHQATKKQIAEERAARKKLADEQREATRQLIEQKRQLAAEARKALAEEKAQARLQDRTANGLGREIGRFSAGVENQSTKAAASTRQMDMSGWEKLADKYAMSIDKASANVEKLKHKLAEANIEEKRKIELQAKIAEGEKQIAALTQRSTEHVTKARQAEEARAKAAADDLGKQRAAEARGAMNDLGMISGVAGAALTAGIASAAKEFGNFEAQMIKFNAVSNATADEMAAIEKQARDLGASTKYTAAEIGAAQVELAKMGFSAKETVAAMGAMVDAAIASGDPLEEVSATIAATIRMFNMSANDAGKVADQITRGANISAQSFKSYSDSMRYVGAAANGLNQDLGTVATALNVLADRQIKGTQAGEHLKIALNRLATQPKPAAEAIKDLNLQIADTKGTLDKSDDTFRNFFDIIKQIKAEFAAKGYNSIEQTNFLKKLFGAEAVASMRIFTDASNETIDAAIAKQAAFAGSTKETADKMKQGFNYAIEEMQGAINDLQITIGKDVAPVIIAFADGIKGVAEAFKSIPEPVRKVISIVSTLAAGVLTAFAGAAGINFVVRNGADAFSKLAAVMTGKVVPANVAVARSAGSAATGLAESTLAARGLVGISFVPFTLGLAAVATEIWLIVDAYKAWKDADDERRNAEGNYRAPVGGSRTDGALELIRNIPDDKVTPEQANNAATDASQQLLIIRRQLSELQQIDETTRKSNANQSTYEEREKALKLKKELTEAGYDFEGMNLKTIILQARAKLQQLEKDAARADKLNKDLNKSKPPGVAESEKPDPNLSEVDAKTDEKVRQIIQAIDDRFDKKLKEEIGKSKQQAASAHQEDTHIHADPAATQGYVPTSKFGKRFHPIKKKWLPHTGQDYGAAAGTPIKSDYAGTVIKSEWMGGYGNAVVVDAGNGNFFLYGHASKFYKKVGDVVKKGEAVAAVGSTGNSTGPHLHKELRFSNTGRWEDAVPIDPVAGRHGTLERSQDEIEAAIKIRNIQERITALKAEQAKFTDKESKEFKALAREIEKYEGNLAEAKGQSAEAGQRAREQSAKEAARLEQQRIANEKAAQEEITRIAQQNRDAQIALMAEGYKKTEAERQSELAKVREELAEKLAAHKGNKSQEAQLVKAYDEKIAIVNRQFDKQQLEDKEKNAKALRDLDDQNQQARINIMGEGLEKQQAQIELDLSKQMDAYADQIKELAKNWEQNKDKIRAINDLETQAGIEASRKLRDAVLADETAKANYRKEMLDQFLDDNQKAFDAAFEQLITAKKKQGVSSGALSKSFTRDDLIGLTESLGQSSAVDLLGNLKEQLKVNQDLELVEQRRRDSSKLGSDEYKASSQAMLKLQEQRALIQEKINTLSDTELLKWLKNYQAVAPAIAKINEEQARLQSTIIGISGALQTFSGQFGEIGQKIASGIGLVTNAVTSAQSVIAEVQKAEKGGTLGDFFKDVNNIGGVIGTVTSGITLLGAAFQAITGFIQQSKQAAADLQNELMSLDNTLGEIEQNRLLQRLFDAKYGGASAEEVQKRQDAVDKGDVAGAIGRAKSAFMGSEYGRKYNTAAGLIWDQNLVNSDFGPMPDFKKYLDDWQKSRGVSTVDELMDSIRKESYKGGLDPKRNFKSYAELAGNDMKLLEAVLGAWKDLDSAVNAYDQKTKEGKKTATEAQQSLVDSINADMGNAAVEDAQQKQKKLEALDIQFAQRQIEIAKKYEAQRNDAIKNGRRDLLDTINANELNEAKRSVKATEDQKAEVNRQGALDDIQRTYETEKAKADLQEEGLSKSLNLLSIEKEKERGELDANLEYSKAVWGEGSKEYQHYLSQRLNLDGRYAAQAKGIYEKSNEDLNKTLEQNAEKLKKARQTLFDQTVKNHQAQIKADQAEIDGIERVNQGLERKIQLRREDERLALEKFDAQDLGIFSQRKASVDYNTMIREGLDFIANPDGVLTDTFSNQSLDEAIKAWVEQKTIENENAVGLEEYSATDAAKNQQLYLQKTQEIAAYQARAANEAQKREGLSTKERNALRQLETEAYRKFQDAYRQEISLSATAQVDADQKLIDSNNLRAEAFKARIQENQRQIDVFNTELQNDLALIDEHVQSVIRSNDQWIVSAEKLRDGVKGPLSDMMTQFYNLRSAAESAYNAMKAPVLPVGSGEAPSSGAVLSGGYSAVNYSSGTRGLGSYTQTPESISIPVKKMATGGVVPDGFPNDTFPALLSSGEAVLPTWFTDLLKRSNNLLLGGGGGVYNNQRANIEINIHDSNNPGAVRKEIFQALKDAGLSPNGASINGAYYGNLGLN